MAGQRPDLQAVTGPDYYEVFARTRMEKCWRGEPEQRPTFGGENHFHVYTDSFISFIVISCRRLLEYLT